MLAGVHILLAERTGLPPLAMSEPEAREICKRGSAVLAHYSFETTQKTLDWLAFGGCLSMAYLPRIAACGLILRQRAAGPRPAPGGPARAPAQAPPARAPGVNGSGQAAPPASGEPLTIQPDFTQVSGLDDEQ
jgi:hypothetical protein